MDFGDFFFDPYADCERYRSKLPHVHQPGKLQFITFRLADSLPKSVRVIIDAQMRAFEAAYPKPWDKATEQRFNLKFRPRLQELLDRGYGDCILKNPEIRQVVINALEYYNHDEYEYFDYVVMPNHFHLLAVFFSDPTKVMGNLKRFTSRVINNILHRTGTIWDKEVWDRYIRNATHLGYTRSYIQQNPRFLPPNDYTLFISDI